MAPVTSPVRLDSCNFRLRLAQEEGRGRRRRGKGSRLTHGRATPVEHHGVSCPEGLD